MILAHVIAFAASWWLGLYLIARGPRKALLLRAGGGLLAYALTIACGALADSLAIGEGNLLRPLQFVLAFLPALLWTGATIRLLPEESPRRAGADRLWLLGLVPITIILLILTTILGTPTPLRWLLAALVLVPLVGVVVLVARTQSAARPANTVGLLGAATLFFFLGFALLVLSIGPLPPSWAVLALLIDLALLGFVVARFDAFDEGEALGRDMWRSLLAAEGAAMLFGGQVGLAMYVAGSSFALVTLLFSVVAVAVAVAVLLSPVQRLLDRVAFADAPQLQQARAELRESAEALPRVDVALPLADLDDTEFARLTRRALSHYGDLPKLASNPLTQLPVIGDRLAARGVADHPLERAAELKQLLAESIARLKPREPAFGQSVDFGTSDAWRHYNALYFPYVVGLRPYSRRATHDDLDATAQRALDWFASQVPERTLYNWQNAAAKLVADDLRRVRTDFVAQDELAAQI